MAANDPTRRAVTAALGGAFAAAVLLPSGARAGIADSAPRPFHLAGIRFIEDRPRTLPRGMRLAIRLESFGEQRGYAVYADGGDLVGYVPKAVASKLLPRRRLAARVIASDRHALPWKRHLVALT